MFLEIDPIQNRLNRQETVRHGKAPLVAVRPPVAERPRVHRPAPVHPPEHEVGVRAGNAQIHHGLVHVPVNAVPSAPHASSNLHTRCSE